MCCLLLLTLCDPAKSVLGYGRQGHCIKWCRRTGSRRQWPAAYYDIKRENSPRLRTRVNKDEKYISRPCVNRQRNECAGVLTAASSHRGTWADSSMGYQWESSMGDTATMAACVCVPVCIQRWAISCRLCSLSLCQYLSKLSTCIIILPLDQAQTKEQSPLGDSAWVE